VWKVNGFKGRREIREAVEVSVVERLVEGVTAKVSNVGFGEEGGSHVIGGIGRQERIMIGGHSARKKRVSLGQKAPLGWRGGNGCL
jgi:hypothetical protein